MLCSRIEWDICNMCHVNLHFHKVTVTMTRPTTADYQMVRFTPRALRWHMTGKYQIRISHTVRSQRLQHQQ